MKKILLVKDKEEIRLLVQATLEGSDFDFLNTVNGKEAVRKAVSARQDIIYRFYFRLFF